MARTLGAPDTVPAGRRGLQHVDGRTLPAASAPDTCDVRCITWL